MDFRHLDGEEIFGLVIALFVVSGIGFLAFLFISFCREEARFYKAEPIRIEATLLNCEYNPSTITTHSAPVFNGKGGMSVAVYSSGHDEIHTTIWDCGSYGRLISTEKRVYRFARPKSVLILKQVDDEVRIWDIDNTAVL